ncbi:MAG: 2-phospho-L-lactate transferase [Roseiflexaceae bacterium]|jgi:LPPG:FO 2-phospho-L-lactate transferase
MNQTVVLSGGVGAARFLEGLVNVLPADSICAIVNTGDDIEMHGLHISPDVDIVICTLAGIIHPNQGWGIVDDTDHCMSMLGKLGASTWFMLGDKDMALHIQRTALMKQGFTATQISQQFCDALGVAVRILPMTHDNVHTHIRTPQGLVHFQHFLVRDRAQSPITGIEYVGIASAQATADVHTAIATAQQIIIAPSNPLVSVGTILGLPGITELLRNRRVPAIAVSPIVGGKAIKGPLVPMLQNAGIEVSALGIAMYYQGLIDGMVIDQQDADLAAPIEALGVRVRITDTVMRDRTRKTALAEQCLELIAEFR